MSAGGRVLSVVGTGPTLEQARHRAYAAVGRIELAGSHHRTDIARRAIDGYGSGVDSSFAGTPEETFLKDVLAALEGDDAERLGAAVDSFSRRSTLDAWKLRLLSSVRASLVAAEASDLM